MSTHVSFFTCSFPPSCRLPVSNYLNKSPQVGVVVRFDDRSSDAVHWVRRIERIETLIVVIVCVYPWHSVVLVHWNEMEMQQKNIQISYIDIQRKRSNYKWFECHDKSLRSITLNTWSINHRFAKWTCPALPQQKQHAVVKSAEDEDAGISGPLVQETMHKWRSMFLLHLCGLQPPLKCYVIHAWSLPVLCGCWETECEKKSTQRNGMRMTEVAKWNDDRGWPKRCKPVSPVSRGMQQVVFSWMMEPSRRAMGLVMQVLQVGQSVIRFFLSCLLAIIGLMLQLTSLCAKGKEVLWFAAVLNRYNVKSWRFPWQ